MFEKLMIIGLILIIIAIVVMIKLNKSIQELLKQSKEIKKETNRKHPNISKAKFDNVLKGRTNVYDKYKNKDGLYEPVTSKNGIELKNRKGE